MESIWFCQIFSGQNLHKNGHGCRNFFIQQMQIKSYKPYTASIAFDFYQVPVGRLWPEFQYVIIDMVCFAGNYIYWIGNGGLNLYWKSPLRSSWTWNVLQVNRISEFVQLLHLYQVCWKISGVGFEKRTRSQSTKYVAWKSHSKPLWSNLKLKVADCC
jgi:hypothetical protein